MTVFHSYLPRILLVFFLFAGCSIVQPSRCFSDENGCDLAKHEIDQKRRELDQYLEAIQNRRNNTDKILIRVLNFKIAETVEALQRAEDMLEHCPKREQPDIFGLSSVKSEDGKYVTMSCGDLRKVLIQLLRKINSLKKREFSTFSELDSAERANLREIQRELQGIEEILRARCTALPRTAALPMRTEPKKPR